MYPVQDKLIRFAACFYLQLAEYREAILDFLAVLQGAGEGYLIGVFQVGAEGKSAGKAGDFDVQRANEPLEVHGGGLPLEVGVGGEDDLRDHTILES